MAGPTPPKTPTARKSLPDSPTSTMQNIPASGSPSSLQKRRWQGDNVSLPLQGLVQPEGATFAHITPTKRQRLKEDTKDQSRYGPIPASPLRNQMLVPMPHHPQPAQTGAMDQQLELAKNLFITAMQRNVELRMPDPGRTPVVSMRIDRIAHVMWDVVFQKEDLMTNITTKASMFPQIKLRALARLNYLPSWWLLREMACAVMIRQNWLLDDSDMQKLWANTLEWCRRVEVKFGIQGDDAAPVKQEVRKGLPGQQQTSKVES